jgi:hypothetical protein
MVTASTILMATRVFCVFVATTAVLLNVLPRPLLPVDYLMTGVLSSLIAMATLFISLVGIRTAMPVRRPGGLRRPDTRQSSAADQHS